jgi:hypothetical protein
MITLVISKLIEYLFDNQNVWIRHFHQWSHYCFVASIVEKSPIVKCKITHFDPSEHVSVKTHKSIFLRLKFVSESFSLEIKLLNVSTLPQFGGIIVEYFEETTIPHNGVFLLIKCI